MFCLIGNAPSSGSTLLADLLDSTPISACGPELEFFCNKNLYDFSKFKQKPTISNIANLKSTGIYPQYQRLNSYGIKKDLLFNMINSSTDLNDFIDTFSNHFLDFRNKNKDGIVFEKTPQNINCIQEFLNQTNGYFIYITRNPIYVFNSLINRGWGSYIALGTWLITTAQYISYHNHPRVILVKYEELVKSPFKIVNSIIKKTSGIELSIDTIEKTFSENVYRKQYSTSIKSWGVNNEKGKVKNANEKKISNDRLEQFSLAYNMSINSSYSNHYSIPACSYNDLINQLGYTKECHEMTSKITKLDKLQKSNWDQKKLFSKWLREFIGGHSKMNDFSIFKNPLQIKY